MSEQKHTPGPMTVDDVFGDDEGLAVVLDYDVPDAGRPIVVANVFFDDDPCLPVTITREQAVANAKLFAAADDMLKAIEAAMRIEPLWMPVASSLEHQHEVSALAKMRESFVNAISKATNPAPSAGE